MAHKIWVEKLKFFVGLCWEGDGKSKWIG